MTELQEQDGNGAERLGSKVECLELLDIDRNLLRSDRFTKIVESALEDQGITSEKMHAIQQEVEASGGSFDTFSELRKLYDDDFIDQVKKKVLAKAALRQNLDYGDEKCLYYPGARELIQKKPPGGTVRSFLTRGGMETQQLKLDIFGVDLDKEYYSIVPLDNKQTKAEMCVGSYMEDTGTFLFKWLRQGRWIEGQEKPKLVNVWADSVIIVDDKPSELMALGDLVGTEARAIGYLHRTGDNMKSQRIPEGKKLPLNVIEVSSLDQIGRFGHRIGRIALFTTIGLNRANGLGPQHAILPRLRELHK